jgi:hypothetical protein
MHVYVWTPAQVRALEQRVAGELGEYRRDPTAFPRSISTSTCGRRGGTAAVALLQHLLQALQVPRAAQAEELRAPGVQLGASHHLQGVHVREPEHHHLRGKGREGKREGEGKAEGLAPTEGAARAGRACFSARSAIRRAR